MYVHRQLRSSDPQSRRRTFASANRSTKMLTGDARESAILNMVSMGFERADVERCFEAAFNNPERAMEYLLEGPPPQAAATAAGADTADDASVAAAVAAASFADVGLGRSGLDDAQEEDDEEAECKMVVVVRTDLGMGVGKVAAQVAHAAMGALRDNLRSDEQLQSAVLMEWDEQGEPTIVLQVPTAGALDDICAKAKSKGLPVHEVRDAGRTEVEAGTTTCAAIGPSLAMDIDEVTGSLRLL